MKRTQGRVGIRRRLFTCFTLFSLFIIVVLWISQILLLDRFYYRTTLDSLRRASDSLITNYGSDTYEEQIQSIALDEQFCISIYKVGKNEVSSIYSKESSIGCVAHKLTGAQLGLVYNRALAGEGEYYTSSTLKLVYNPRFKLRELRAFLPGEMTDDTTNPEMSEDTPNLPVPQNGQSVTADERLLYCRLFNGTDESVLMIVMDANLAPVASVVKTLQLLLVAISVVILAFSLLLAYIISSKLSRPLMRMSEKAKTLSDGRYDTDFSDSSYKEVRELGEALNHASEELSSVERMQRELIANISHDLRTPLTMIKGYAELMRDIEGENTPENTQVIIDETERLSDLVNDVLVISRHQAGKEKAEFTRFDLFCAVSECVERYRHLKGAEGFEFSLELSGKGCVCADRSAILQVTTNLINNAINHAEDKKIRIKCYSTDTTVHVDVIDSGKGIPEAELPHIWERYYKLDKSHTRSRVGSGLGLSIVREILELHSARYGVESSVGFGSRFWFELPADIS